LTAAKARIVGIRTSLPVESFQQLAPDIPGLVTLLLDDIQRHANDLLGLSQNTPNQKLLKGHVAESTLAGVGGWQYDLPNSPLANIGATPASAALDSSMVATKAPASSRC
jgi:hypothetical protein